MDNDTMLAMQMLNSSLTNAANVAIASGTHHEDRQFAREMYDKQVQTNRENWQLQNEYNAPSAQMERLLAAGLNPNLVYGSGAVGNNASLPSSASPQSVRKNMVTMEPLDILGPYMQLRMFDKQQELLNAQIRDVNASAANKEAETSYIAPYLSSRNLIAESDAFVKDNIREYLIRQEHNKTAVSENDVSVSNMYALPLAAASLENSLADVLNKAMQRKYTQAQIASAYKDIEYKDAMINKVIADTGVSYATADKIYTDITTNIVDSYLKVYNSQLNPFNGEMGTLVNSFMYPIRRVLHGDQIKIYDETNKLFDKLDRLYNNVRYPVRNRRIR